MGKEQPKSSRSKPWYQRLVIYYLTWFIGAFLFIGSILDSISNSIALITPVVSYVGCIVIILTVFLVQFTIRRHSLKWITPDGQETRFISLWPWLHIVSLGVILLLLIPRVPDWASKKRIAVPDPEPVTFKNTETFNVLILPFEALEDSTLKKLHIESVLQKRLIDMSSEQNLDLAATYLPNEKSPLTFDAAIEIGRRHKANLVIWGNYYEQVHSDNTQMDIRYALVDSGAPNVRHKGRTPISEIKSLSLLQKGFLQEDIDYIIYWTLALKGFSQGSYDKALNHFTYVESKFADRFTGSTQVQFDVNGFRLIVNKPSTQLYYNLAYCYFINGDYERSIQYWNAILAVGGSSGRDGSRVVYDPFTLAIAAGDKDVIIMYATTLLNRATAYREIGKIESAQRDIQTFIGYSKESPDLASFYASIKDKVDHEMEELSKLRK